MIELAERCDVPWVVTNDPRYTDESSRVVHDMLTALRHEMDVAEALRAGVLHPNGEWKLISPADMHQRWQGREAGIYESARIAADIEPLELAWMRPPLPEYNKLAGRDADDFLRARAYEGARTRWGDTLTAPQVKQIDHELGLIARLGFAGFFLVMWDAVRFAQSNGILCQGRGERREFGRHLLPRHHSGGSGEGRITVRAFSFRSAGRRQHGTAGHRRRLRARPARGSARLHVREIQATARGDRVHRADVSRAERGARCDAGVWVSRGTRDVDFIAAAPLRSGGRGDPHAGRVRCAGRRSCWIRRACARCCARSRDSRDCLACVRRTSAGSSFRAGRSVTGCRWSRQRWVAPSCSSTKTISTRVGVPKWDFLGLGGLSMVRRAFDAIEIRTGTRPEMYKLPYDNDPKTYELISRGDTVGTFQIESRAQIASIVHTKPEGLYDIVVQVALIRPGPIQAKFVRPYTRPAARAGKAGVHASAARADPQAHAGDSDFSGTGDVDRDGARRLHGR